MTNLKFLAEYGFIDIIFGIGSLGIISRLVTKLMPSNLDELHVNADFSAPNSNLLFVQISNSGGRNIYISRVFFKPRAHEKIMFRNKYVLAINPRANFKNISRKFYELRFGDGTKDYDCLLKPGFENKVSTALQLDSLPSYPETGSGLFGKVVIEYATYGKQGKHVIKI